MAVQPALHAEDILPSQPPDDAPSGTAGHGGVRNIRELRDMWWQEAEANGVMPLDDGSLADIILLRQPTGLMSGRNLTLYPGQGHEPLSGMIAAGERSMGLVAHLSAPWQGDSGRPVASGNSLGGDTPCIQNDGLSCAHVPMGDCVTVVVPPPKGAASVAMTPQVSAKSAAKLRLFADRGAFAQGNIPSQPAICRSGGWMPDAMRVCRCHPPVPRLMPARRTTKHVVRRFFDPVNARELAPAAE
ncbi:hypothetical protein [Phaeovulum sp. W22_SRMD_FR3]|uniref:hypothetical protein n=1 Tax=Phaeovulum sp. W22_SRMD_FR3 TaxID=3240274 RepID=UPI003F94E3B4